MVLNEEKGGWHYLDIKKLAVFLRGTSSNEEKVGWHFLAIKKISAFLKGTSSKNKLIEIFIV